MFATPTTAWPRPHGRRRPAAAVCAALLSLLGCAAETTGPTPVVAGLSPSLACGEQRVTEVRISGAALSPLAIDAATGDPKLALPDVTVERVAGLDGLPAPGTPIALPNDPAAPGAAQVRWTSATSMAFDVYPELALAPGLYRATVRNANGRAATLEEAFTIVPRPTLVAAEPDLICDEQDERTVTLRGAGFLAVGSALPTVAFGEVVLAVVAVEDCAELPGPTAARTCGTARVTVPEDALAPGAPPLVVTNPDPAGCSSEDAVTLAVIPAPTLASVEPDLICTAEGDRTLTLTGTGFVTVGASLPQVSFGATTLTAASADGCVAIEGTLLDAQRCDTLTVVVPQDGIAPGAHAVTVTNPEPAGCASEQVVTLAVTPPPSIAAIEADLTCLDEGARTFTLSGAGFLTIDGELPVISVGGTPFVPDAALDCAPVEGTLLAAQRCDTLTLTLPEAAVAAGSHDLVVTNPPPAGCSSSEAVTLAVVPQPTVASIAPDLFCPDDGGAAVTVTGEGFVAVGDALPLLLLDGIAVQATAVQGCSAIAGTLLDARSCTGLTATVPPATVPAGARGVAVRNPEPAGCTSDDVVTVAVVGAPVIDAIVPPAICSDAQPAELTVAGSGFLVVDGAQPTVTVDGAAVTVTAAAGCAAVAGTSLSTESCTSLVFAVPAGGFAIGVRSVQVTNPAPAGCDATAAGSFEVTPTPTVTSIEPAKVCADGGFFAVEGTGFAGASRIILSQGATDSELPTTFIDTEHLRGDVAAGTAAGTYDVSVVNAATCPSNKLIAALRVVDAPAVFFVDPPQAFNGIDLQLTIFVSGVTDDVLEVGIRPTGTADPVTPLVFSFDPARANRILAALPAGTAAGDYDVVVQDVACGATLVDGLHVTDVVDVSVASVDLPFGFTGERTAVTIRGVDPPPAGELPFAPTPRAYLNPTDAGALATELQALSFQSESRLTGTVPAGLVPGTYDLIVVNPDGHVGLLRDAFEVVANPVPRIDALSPAAILNKVDQALVIRGADFRDPIVSASSCRDPAGAPIAPPTVTVTAFTATTIDTVWDASGVAGGGICVVRVTDVDRLADGRTQETFSEFSALSITNPSANLNPFQASSALTTARRAAAGAAVRLNQVERFVFALGGDDGAAAGALDSVEAAPVDPFGVVGAWAPQRNRLPAPRTLGAATVIGRFIYLAGGSDGAAAVTSVLRAYLLDPVEAPTLNDLDIAKGDGAGLDGGIWHYRVAAVMASDDPNNPDGEALPSEPLLVQLPDLVEKVHLTLFWTSVPGAARYRIYRTPAPDAGAGAEVLLADVAATGVATETFVDTVATLDPAGETPLPLGSLGVWHQPLALAAAREGAAVTAVPDPNDPTVSYLYVLGGRTGTTALSSYEWSVVTTTASNAQDAAALTLVSAALPTGRWQAGAVFIDETRATSVAAGQAFVYVLPGLDGPGTGAVREVTAFAVDTVDGVGADDGRLGSPTDVVDPGAAAGYGYAAGNNFLFVLGGFAALPSNAGKSAEVCVAGTPGCAQDAPTLKNFNAGITLLRKRYLAASAAESGFVFLLGGQTDTEAASTSTERTNF